jgi:hypothetical protein
LYNFKDGNAGATPNSNLVFDSSGNLYGATSSGGGTGCDEGYGCGSVFRLKPPAQAGEVWTETVLFRFDGTDGPEPGWILLKDGAIYGTAFEGGQNDNGLVFEMKPENGA